MSNIREIAKRAGVGIATVSRYINKNGYVSDEVKVNIQNAIDESNYKPNALARALFTKNSKTIGLMIPNITNPFFNQLSLVIEEYASSRGYSIFLCNTNDMIEKEKKYLDVLQSNRVAGIISARGKCKDEYRVLDMPVISLENNISEDIITVSSDNYNGGKTAFEHLYDCGCRNILHIKGPKDFLATEERCKGFLDAAKGKDIKIDIIELKSDFHVKMFEENIKELNNITQYDGIFVFNDIAASVIIKLCNTRKIKVPEQVQIIGFDNSFISELMYPSLTTISQQIEQLGRMTIELLIKAIEGEKVKIQKYYIDTKLIERESTKKTR